LENKAESVLVVETNRLRPFLKAYGLIKENLDAALAVIAERAVFLPRREAEQNPAYKQIIPYMALLRGGEVFATRRLSKGGEARLHGLLSLGLGGHINPVDLGKCSADGCGAARAALQNGLRRELREEVFIERAGEPRFVGLINDDGTEVGSVHVGLFCVLPTEGAARVREAEKLEGFWLRRDTLQERLGEMETWSAIVTGFLADLL